MYIKGDGKGRSENSVQELNFPKNGEREIKYGQFRERGIILQTHKQLFIMSIVYSVKRL